MVEQLATSKARLVESGVKEREKLVRAEEEELERRAVLEREALVGGGRVVLSAPLYCTTPRKVGTGPWPHNMRGATLCSSRERHRSVAPLYAVLFFGLRFSYSSI